MDLTKKFLRTITHPYFSPKKEMKKDSSASKLKTSLQVVKNNGTELLILRNPKEKEVSYLKDNFNFHPIHLEDITSTIQRPKIDEEENYIFFVFHFPQFNHKTKRVESKEVDFFLTKNTLVVVIDEEFRLVEKIIDSITEKKEIKEKYFHKGPEMLLYWTIDSLVDSIFPIIDKIELNLENIDKRVFSEDSKNVTEELSLLRRNVVFLQSMIKPELNSFISIEEKSTHPFIHQELKTYLSNITDHLKKIWDRLEDLRELSDNLSQTFESYLSFKTNETIKILTIFSVILLPLTLLSGIYGMNLNFLPVADHPYALLFITLIMGVIVSTMLAFFKIKKWI